MLSSFNMTFPSSLIPKDHYLTVNVGKKDKFVSDLLKGQQHTGPYIDAAFTSTLSLSLH